MRIVEVEQGSQAWLDARCGLATASEFSSILAKGQGKTRSAYLRRVVAERLTGKPTETYNNGHMERGKDLEPLARASYEMVKGVWVRQVGLIVHDDLPVGASPDGLVGDEGGTEIKSVIPTVQIETIERGTYPPEHKAQIQGCLWLSGRKWWDFVSYSPDMPVPMDTYIFRVVRDEDYIVALEKEVRAFLVEVDQSVEKLKRYSPLTESQTEPFTAHDA